MTILEQYGITMTKGSEVDIEFENDDQDEGPAYLHADRILPYSMLKAVLGEKGMAEIADRTAFALVVRAPATSYVAPLTKVVWDWANWNFQLGRTALAKRSDEDLHVEKITNVLASGGRLFGVSQDPETMLPAALLTGADQMVELPLPSSQLIADVIRQVTGDLPVSLPDPAVSRLDFGLIASAIRAGSTAAECVARLNLAAQRKTSAIVPPDGVAMLKELHGYEGAAMEWAEDLLLELSAWRRGEVPWSSLPSSAILCGPPGVGKTALVRSLAKSAGVPLIATTVGDWFNATSGYLDAVIKKVSAVFETARAQAPAIIFIDEIDGLPARGNTASRNNDYWTPLVNFLLTTLDGIGSGSTEGLIVVAATNHPSLLDPALVRPGRFSRFIEIDMPSEKALVGIMRQYLGDDLVGEDLEAVVRLMTGATGAHVVQHVESARRRARRQDRSVHLSDLIAVVAPPESRSQEEIWRTALHEAGHGVAARELGVGDVETISIVAAGSSGGFVRLRGRHAIDTTADIEALVVQILAGRAAEEVMLGDPGVGAGGDRSSDLSRATRMLGMLHLSSGGGDTLLYRADPEDTTTALALDRDLAEIVEAHLKRLYQQAVSIIFAHKDIVKEASRELIQKRSISGAELDRIFDRMRGIGNADTR